jgi:hypothetical protein
MKETYVEQPLWLKLPAEEKIWHTYWTCMGQSVKQSWLSRCLKRVQSKTPCIVVFHSKEEAEANSASPGTLWKWNGKPAVPITLSDAMQQARKLGLHGVAIKGFQNGEWRILKIYRANEPLL